MIPAPFDYEVADSAAHALSLLAEHGEDAKLLAGGHSLLPMMKVRLAQPAVLIDIARVSELSGIRSRGRRAGHRRDHRHAEVAGSDLVGPRRRCSPTPPRRSATRRSGTAARSAARSRTPTRRPTCR